jgi:hypothetical protein
MKRFFLRLAFFLVTSFILINIVAAIYGAFSRSRYERDGSETFAAIRLAQTPSSNANIILGDSVCHQLLLDVNLPDTLNLSCNQAISLCGQYLLAREAIAHDPAIKQITLAYQPACFTNDLDQKFTFNYVVKPFYVHANLRDGMDALVMQRLDRRPFYRLIAFPMFRYTDALGATDYSDPAPTAFAYLSPISVDYLRKLSDLCQAHQIHLRIVSTPISKTSGYDESLFVKEVSAAHLDNVFAGYTQTIRQVDPDLLLDNVHFKPQEIGENSAEFVKLLER